MDLPTKLNLLNWYIEIGCDTLYFDKPQDRTKQERKEQRRQAISSHHLTETRKLANSAQTLEDLRQIVMDYNGCALKHSATNTVFSDGDPKADLMLIGEAPGQNEDKQGIPFCGQSGKLLNNILASIGIAREKAYITNTVFWRPPGNRRPTTSEIHLCRPFVEKHIALIKPKLIAIVGNTAVESLLDRKVPMGQLRGKFFEYRNEYLESPIDSIVIFHPSYLLRQPAKKKLMWEDALTIKERLNG